MKNITNVQVNTNEPVTIKKFCTTQPIYYNRSEIDAVVKYHIHSAFSYFVF